MTVTRQVRPAAPSVAEISLPADARSLSTLPRIDYVDAFIVTGAGERSPEHWVSAVLREAPPRVRRRLVLGWVALGLKLGPPWSADGVLGWSVQRSEPGFVLLAADSWLGFRVASWMSASIMSFLVAAVLTVPAAAMSRAGPTRVRAAGDQAGA